MVPDTVSQEKDAVLLGRRRDHIVSIVVFGIAVAAYKSERFLQYSLGFVFLIAIVGHMAGAWEVGATKTNWNHRISLSLCGVLGIVLLAAGFVLLRGASLWTILVTFVVVLVAWIWVRVRIDARTMQASSGLAEEACGL